MRQIEKIKELYELGESKSYIATTLGLDRKTVSKYIQRYDFNETFEDYIKRHKPRGSKLDPYKAEIDELLMNGYKESHK